MDPSLRVLPLRRAVAAGVLAWCAGALPASAQVRPDTPGWFPFTPSPVDVVDGTAIDLSGLNSAVPSGRIGVRDGHFVDARGQRLRLLGTNLTFGVCFPDKADAPRLARRLAQLGFNVVRFHHMDARDIWLPDQSGLDPEKLDRLDWFLFHLGQNGIYANLNLHVSRTYPGLAERKLPQAYKYGKILDRFHEPYIRLQEQYAADLLGRTNPYTRRPLTDDPVVAFVELNNENTLLDLDRQAFADLPVDLRDDLLAQWRAWLARRYPDLPGLARAWNARLTPLGDERLRSPQFADLGAWALEGAKPGVCEWAVSPADDGQPALQVRMAQPGATAWAYQVHQLGVAVEEGSRYTVAFRARGEPARSVSVGLRFAQAPWTHLADSRTVALSSEWQAYALRFTVRGTRPDTPVRLSFNLGAEPGAVWLSRPSLRPGQTLFDPTPVTALDGLGLPQAAWPQTAWADFRRFLVDTERAYGARLRTHLRERLGLRALVVDTQASYGGGWGVLRETASDYIDMHAYWQHPSFPGKPWDSTNWTIGNTSMVLARDGGTFARLASCRVAGKPFSVSEYDHPAPADHAAETLPLLATFAAYQDWDAIYQFTYANSLASLRADKIGGYFELCHHPAQLVFAPVAAVLFRQAAVAPARQPLTVRLPEPRLSRELDRGWGSLGQLLSAADLPPAVMLSSRFALEPVTADVSLLPDAPLPAAPAAGALIGGGQVGWRPADGLFTLEAPAARLAVGRLGGRELDLGDVHLGVGLDVGAWAAVAVVALDGRPVAESARLLLVAAARAENADMGWNETRTSVGNHWGAGPVLAQGVPVRLGLPGAAAPRVFALDPQGVRGAQVPAAAAAGGWLVAAQAEYRTLWYVIER